jgi:hypothetical protein
MPIGRMFPFGQFSKTDRNSPDFGVPFLTVKVLREFRQKMGRASFGAIFLTNSSFHPSSEINFS